MSQLFSPGPEKNLRLEFPICPRASAVHNAVLKYVPLRGSEIASDPGVKFGVSIGSEIAPAPPVPSNELSSVSTSVTGIPVENRVIPLNRQPCTSRRGPGNRLIGSS